MKDVKIMPDGFEIEFLQPVQKIYAEDVSNYAVQNFTYLYHHYYGSPIVQDSVCKVKYAQVSEDRKNVRIVADRLKAGYAHEIKISNVPSDNNQLLLHNTAYYTVKNIPQGDFLKYTETKKTSPAAKTVANAPTPRPTARAAKTSAPAGKNTNTAPKEWGGVLDKTIIIATRPGLIFDQTKITVKAGSKIKLTFSNNDDMLHNIVLVKPGKADEVGNEAVNMGLEGPKIHYVPKSDNVIAHTKLVTPGTSETIYFECPKVPDNYVLVCTYPGHYASMQCALVVVN